MNKFRLTVKLLVTATFLLAFASIAQAQATRTWVSGVGDDVNPCSRTAPCKTFAGAISKTAKDGEISVLDPGGYGTVTITKSITINGTHGAGYGSILSALAPQGVLINITDVNDIRKAVRLISLDINGASSGTDGVRILSALNVHIEDCHLHGFTNRGINDVRTLSGNLFVNDTSVRNTVQSGIVILPAASVTVKAIFDNVRTEFSGSNSGGAFDSSAAGSIIRATLRNSTFSGNNAAGGNGISVSGGNSQVYIVSCSLHHNTTGLSVSAPSTVVLAGSTIINNTTSITGGAQVSSSGDNVITNNSTNNLPSGPGATQG